MIFIKYNHLKLNTVNFPSKIIFQTISPLLSIKPHISTYIHFQPASPPFSLSSFPFSLVPTIIKSLQISSLINTISPFFPPSSFYTKLKIPKISRKRKLKIKNFFFSPFQPPAVTLNPILATPVLYLSSPVLPFTIVKEKESQKKKNGYREKGRDIVVLHQKKYQKGKNKLVLISIK